MRSYFVFGKRKTKLFRITLLSFVLQLLARFIALKVAHYQFFALAPAAARIVASRTCI